MRNWLRSPLLGAVLLSGILLVAANVGADILRLKGSGASFPFLLYGHRSSHCADGADVRV